jgi:hypothetical protein
MTATVVRPAHHKLLPRLVVVSPLVKHVAGKFGAVIAENYLRQTSARTQSLQHSLYPLAGEQITLSA